MPAVNLSDKLIILPKHEDPDLLEVLKVELESVTPLLL